MVCDIDIDVVAAGTQIRLGHMRFASRMIVPVLTPYAFSLQKQRWRKCVRFETGLQRRACRANADFRFAQRMRRSCSNP